MNWMETSIKLLIIIPFLHLQINNECFHPLQFLVTEIIRLQFISFELVFSVKWTEKALIISNFPTRSVSSIREL